jgi:hypothetical protein
MNTIRQLEAAEADLTIEDLDKIYEFAEMYEKKIMIHHFQTMLAEIGISNNLNQSVIDYAFMDLRLQDALDAAAFEMAHKIAISEFIHERLANESNRGADEDFNISDFATKRVFLTGEIE